MTVRVLITNDDGIAAPGIQALAWAARQRGLDVVVAAPMEEASGTSAAMSAVERDGRVVVNDHPLPDLAGVPAYGVAGSPGFITLIALHGAFGPPPSVVLSGVNRGANAGRAVLHSGTVGAAFTAATNGCRAMAVSSTCSRPVRRRPRAVARRWTPPPGYATPSGTGARPRGSPWTCSPG